LLRSLPNGMMSCEWLHERFGMRLIRKNVLNQWRLD